MYGALRDIVITEVCLELKPRRPEGVCPTKRWDHHTDFECRTKRHS
jgi:hypothetical protein